MGITPLNAYLVDAGHVDVIVEYIDYWARKEEVFVFDLVFAPSRGSAKSTFTRAHRRDIEFTDIKHVKLVATDIERERGIACSTDILWDANLPW